MRFILVLVLCSRVAVFRFADGIDLPELESIRMVVCAFINEEFEDTSSTLIMRSDEVNGK